MTDQHVPHATITEDGTHLTIVDAASHTTRLALDIDTLIVERYALQTFYIILTEMTHHSVTAADRHRQSATVSLESTAQHAVYRTQGRSLLCLLPGSGNLTGTAFRIHLRLQLGSPSFSLRLSCSLFGSSLTGSLLCGGTLGSLGSSTRTSLRFSLRLSSSLGSSLLLSLSCSLGSQSCFFGSLSAGSFGSSLTRLGFGYTTGILPGSSLGSSFLASQFLGTFLGGSSGSGLLLSLGSSTGTSLGYFLSNLTVNLCVDCRIFPTLVGNHSLNGLLLFLQSLHHFLLLGLLTFQCRLLLLTLI